MPTESGERWYCLETHYRCELFALAHLVGQGYPAFLPRKERELPDKRRVLAPMFPRYLFVRFDREAERWQPIIHSTGVRRLFGVSPELPIPVPFGIVEKLIAIADRNSSVHVDRSPRVAPIPDGSLVVMVDGPFTDLKATLLMSDGDRVKLLIGIMGREVETWVERGFVEPVGV